MLIYIFTWLLLVSGLSLIYLIVRRMVALRRGQGTFHSDEPSLHVFIKPTIDYSAFRLMTFLKFWWHRFTLVCLTFIAKAISFVKFVVLRVEKRFGKVINSVRGQGTLNSQRGAASIFLRELEGYKK